MGLEAADPAASEKWHPQAPGEIVWACLGAKDLEKDLAACEGCFRYNALLIWPEMAMQWQRVATEIPVR